MNTSFVYFSNTKSGLKCLALCIGCALIPSTILAWGGSVHSSITAAAAAVLSPAALLFLADELKRLIKVYCNYPDINYAVYYGVCRQRGDNLIRVDDIRRDFNAPFYCGFNDLTGVGKYYAHGPAIAFANLKPPYPDEHSADAIKNGRFSDTAVPVLLGRAQTAFIENRYFDAIRLLGAAVHYLQDCTPPPHAIFIQDKELHQAMETFADHSRMEISGYTPRLLADDSAAAMDAAAVLAREISVTARGKAEIIMRLLQDDQHEQAAAQTLASAQIAAHATADILHTMYELNREHLPKIIKPQPGTNLLFNPSFDWDEDGDLHPDGWVREWYDPTHTADMHLWDSVSTCGRGACVRLYGVGPTGAAWRTARSHGVPVMPGKVYELSGMVRQQGDAEGYSCLVLRFQNADYETVAEFSSSKLQKNDTWQRVIVVGTAPTNATDVLAVCMTQDNPRSVLFDDLCLMETNS